MLTIWLDLFNKKKRRKRKEKEGKGDVIIWKNHSYGSEYGFSFLFLSFLFLPCYK